MPNITLLDGSVRQFEHPPVTVAEVATAIGPGLAKAALAGKVDGRLVDVSHRMDADATLGIITDRGDEGLEVIRHSTAHLLAHAVKGLFPDAQVTIGPVIENGFYYDFAYKRPFTPEDLERIEVRMAELAKADIPVSREVWARSEAVEFFKAQGEHYKAEIIASIPEADDVSLYRQGDFIDLCRGPHVPATGKLKVFKLTKVAAPIGAATRRTRCCSASTVPHGRRRKILRPTCTCWRRRKSAITASWVSSSACSISRIARPGRSIGTRKAGPCSSP